jgi:tetratricopeptide (TPR) repeat protein
MGISGKPLRSLLFSLTAMVLVTGCMMRLPEVSPSDIPRLEEEIQVSPDDVDIRTQLGIAYYMAERHDQARTTLQEAIDGGASTGAAFLYLGLANEALEDWSGAEQAYTGYIDAGRYGPLKEEIEKRLTLMVRNELHAQAQAALAQEDQLSQEPPAPRSVAVFPFRLISENQDLLPLQVAMADMMITDLGLSGGLVVLERTQIQSLLDEMALTEAGYVSSESGSRAGRLLRSEHVVQGAMTTLPEQALRFDTDVVHTVRRQSVGETTGEDQLEAIFDLEKATVFQILDVLGVELTPAEREAIDNNRAENILAFLAYGRGLMALDDGDFVAAEGFFNQAIELDPDFDMAGEMAGEAEDLTDATETSSTDVEGMASGEMGSSVGVAETGTEVSAAQTSTILQSTTEEVVSSPASAVATLGQPDNGADTQSTKRDPTQESKGQEGVTRPATATIRITIRKPGGGE